MEELAYNSSNVTPLGLIFLVCMGIMTLRLQQHYALIPLLITVCYIPLSQMIVVGGLHFQFFRILLLIAWCRVWTRKEASDIRLTGLDKLFICWALVTLVAGTLTQPSYQRVINRSGEIYNAIGTYFLVRCWVRDLDDLTRMIRVMSFIIAPLALSMIVEKFTARNVFAIFGGVPEFTTERDGALRCQGAFRHPILAGTYGAIMFPLFLGLWFQQGRQKWSAALGGISSAVVAVAAASSGAFLAFVGALAGFAFWPLRNTMHQVRWIIILMLAALAMTMKAPVWYIIARTSEVVGGTGWYRSYLIDQAIQHFDEWWLVGSTYTAHWAPAGEVMAGNPNNMDIINQYVAEGLGGGVLKLGLFIAMIIGCFKIIGQWTHGSSITPPSHCILAWSLGVTLLTHSLSFLSVTYFDQMTVMWYWLLAVIASLGSLEHCACDFPSHELQK